MTTVGGVIGILSIIRADARVNRLEHGAVIPRRAGTMNSAILRFYTVGVAGIAVQAGTLALLADGAGLHYSVATAIAVEIAIIHNFFWHERWTWAPEAPGTWMRFWKFNVSTGLISIAANLVVTTALVELFGMPYLGANLIAIAVASAATYLVGDRFVFRKDG